MKPARVVEELNPQGAKVDPEVDLAHIARVGHGGDDRNATQEQHDGVLRLQDPGVWAACRQAVLDHPHGSCLIPASRRGQGDPERPRGHPKELLPSHLHEAEWITSASTNPGRRDGIVGSVRVPWIGSSSPSSAGIVLSRSAEPIGCLVARPESGGYINYAILTHT